jgi:hypothetical protein
MGLITGTLGKFVVKSPKALVEGLQFDPKVPGSIEYTTANWGNINYLEKSLYQVVYVEG